MKEMHLGKKYVSRPNLRNPNYYTELWLNEFAFLVNSWDYTIIQVNKCSVSLYQPLGEPKWLFSVTTYASLHLMIPNYLPLHNTGVFTNCRPRQLFICLSTNYTDLFCVQIFHCQYSLVIKTNWNCK